MKQNLKTNGIIGMFLGIVIVLSIVVVLPTQAIEADLESSQQLFVPGQIVFKVKAGEAASNIINNETETEFIVSADEDTGIPVIDKKLKDGSVEEITPALSYLRKKQTKESISEDPLGPVYVMTLKNKDKKSVEDAIEELSADPSIEYAEPNFIFQLTFVPNDPYFSSSGSWGQQYGDLWGLQRLQTEQAWDTTQGQEVIVAVIDTGIQYNHPDLFTNIYQNPGETGDGRETNGVDDDGNGLIDDWRGYDFESRDNPRDNDATDFFGHGTHVSGTIGAVANNGIGIAGVAPQVKILPVKVFQDQNNPTAIATDIVAGVRYAADMGARVTNNSYGGEGTSQLITDAFNYAIGRGVVNVAAAGNSALDASGFHPANIPGVIAVAASTYTDRRASFSNFGSKVDIAAPGAGDSSLAPDSPNDGANNILSTMASNAFIAQGSPGLKVSEDSGFAYVRIRGTSMASPHAAGVAALAIAAYPNETPAEIRGRLRATASPFAIAPEAGRPIGAGVVNARRAVTEQAHPVFSVRNFRVIQTSDGDLFPESNETISLALEIQNQWQSASNVAMTLSASHPGVVGVPTSTVSLGSIATDETKNNVLNPFVVQLGSVSSSTVVEFALQTDADGYSQTFNIPLAFGVPVFNPISNIRSFTFHAIVFPVNAVDPAGLPLTYEALSLPAGAVFTSGHNFIWNGPSQNQVGVYDVTFKATNPNGYSGMTTVRITVEPNHNPYFLTTQTQYNAVRNQLFMVQIQATDPDVVIDANGNSIPDYVSMRLRDEITHPAWLHCTQGGSGVLNCSGTPTRNGTDSATIEANDGYYGGTPSNPEIVLSINVRRR